MLLLAFLVLITGPGAVITFGLPNVEMNWHTKLGMGVALTPIVVAGELIVLKAAGVPYPMAAYGVMGLGLVGLFLAARAVRYAELERDALLGQGVTLLFLALLCFVLWNSFGDRLSAQYTQWHALHHTDISYATIKPGIIPGDPALAGSWVRYPFLAHYFWGWLGWLMDIPPNAIYRWTNSAWLIVVGGLQFEFIRRLGVRPLLCALGVVLMFSGNNIIAALYDVTPSLLKLPLPVDDMRYTTFLQKFYSFNLVPFGLGLAAAVMVLSTQMLGERTAGRSRSTVALLCLCLCALGTVYPLFFPAVCVAVLGTAAFLVLPIERQGATLTGRDAIWLITGLAIASLISIAYLLFCLSGRDAPTVLWTWSTLLSKSRLFAISLAPLALVILPSIKRGIRESDRRLLFPLLLLSTSAGFFLLAPIAGGNEYKAVFLATMAAAALGATALSSVLAGRRAMTLATIAFLAGVVLWVDIGHLARLNAAKTGAKEPEFALDSFALSLAPGRPGEAWTTAVRTMTPENTVLLTPPQIVPPTVLTQRELFVAGGSYWLGYKVDIQTMVVKVRGGSQRLYHERMNTYLAVYEGRPWAYPLAYSKLAALGRPVAFHFKSRAHPFLVWLQQHHSGRALLDSPSDVVWYLEVLSESAQQES